MFRSLGWGSINCYELLYVKFVFIYNLKTPAMLELSTELSVLSKPAWPLWAILKCRVRHTFRRRTSQVSSNRVNSSFLIKITALTASPFVAQVQVFLFCWMRVNCIAIRRAFRPFQSWPTALCAFLFSVSISGTLHWKVRFCWRSPVCGEVLHHT